ncbi:MAG TPA: ABC transporter ATP-binding protein [Armatimonadaceae bacterium]|nr:ABC transporter ATP-binding protein [Armatimonadaceae bacterium]
MADAIVIKNLTKQYPVPLKNEVVNAVDNLSLNVGEGEIFGFLGANGAGKTTTIKILLGLIFPTAGEASVLGAPAGDIAVKHKVAYLPESPYFYEHMTAPEVITFYAQLFGMHREDARRKAAELVDLVGLGGKSDVNKRIHEFSKGMRQRVGIAQSLINDPTVLFYDEPTSGLDAIARRDIRDLMLLLKSQGKTMFLSSHQLEDVEAVCHRVSIIHKGKLRVLGTVEELLAGERVDIVATGIDRTTGDRIGALVPGATIRTDGTRTLVNMASDQNAVWAVTEAIRAAHGNLVAVSPKRRTLEDLFVEVVGERIIIEDDIATTEKVAANAAGAPANGAAGNGRVEKSPASAADVPGTASAAPSASASDTAAPSASTPSASAPAADEAARTKPSVNKYKELHRK